MARAQSPAGLHAPWGPGGEGSRRPAERTPTLLQRPHKHVAPGPQLSRGQSARPRLERGTLLWLPREDRGRPAALQETVDVDPELPLHPAHTWKTVFSSPALLEQQDAVPSMASVPQTSKGSKNHAHLSPERPAHLAPSGGPRRHLTRNWHLTHSIPFGFDRGSPTS